MMVDNENVPSFSKVEDDLDKGHPSNKDGNGNHIVSRSLYKATNPSTMLLDKDALCWVVNSQEFGRDGISKLFFFKGISKLLVHQKWSICWL